MRLYSYSIFFFKLYTVNLKSLGHDKGSSVAPLAGKHMVLETLDAYWMPTWQYDVH